MQSINALSITPDARAWLTNSRHPLILHVFDRACNLINERREVLSIVTQQIGNGPFNIVVEDDACFAEHLSLELVSVFPTQLILGDLTINTGNTKLWSPRPDWETLHAKRDDILNQLASLPIANYQKRGLDTPFAKTAQPYSTTTLTPKLPLTNYQSLISNLCSSLAIADLPNCITSAKQLAGLGIGLTPAGDDFIMGAVLAAWIIHPIEITSVLAKEITNAAAPLTTSLSAAWLKSAGRGEAGILWHDFFGALRFGDSSATQLQITKLLSIGHTSGADALAGFINTLQSFVEYEMNLCPS